MTPLAQQTGSAGFVELMLTIIKDSLAEIPVAGRNAGQVTSQD